MIRIARIFAAPSLMRFAKQDSGGSIEAVINRCHSLLDGFVPKIRSVCPITGKVLVAISGS
jgi:hypothetical protein